MENENYRQTQLLEKNDDEDVKTKGTLSSNKKVFPLEKKTKESVEEDIKIFNIFDPETGKYIRKIVKKTKK